MAPETAEQPYTQLYEGKSGKVIASTDGLIEVAFSASYPFGGVGGPFIMYLARGVPSGRVKYSIEKYGLITSMAEDCVVDGYWVGVSVVAAWAAAVFQSFKLITQISTTITEMAARILHFALMLIFILHHPHIEKIEIV
jgi:hypothetical protein